MTRDRAYRLVVDRVRCDGHGLCRDLLPGRVALDEWGYPIVVDLAVTAHSGRDDEGDARRAVAACPSLALRLERTSTPPVVAPPASRR